MFHTAQSQSLFKECCYHEIKHSREVASVEFRIPQILFISMQFSIPDL